MLPDNDILCRSCLEDLAQENETVVPPSPGREEYVYLTGIKKSPLWSFNDVEHSWYKTICLTYFSLKNNCSSFLFQFSYHLVGA